MNQDAQPQERVALVTGGSRGIGRAIVLALGAAGWTVVFSYHTNAAAAQEVTQALEDIGRTAYAVKADTANAEDREWLVNTALENCGGIDLLVNNAGMGPRQRADLLELGEASYDEVMATNLKGPFFLTQRVARVMVEQVRSEAVQPQAGQPAFTPKIINIGSLSAYTSSANRGEYCLSKAGMGMLTALFADRLAGDGILVYEVRPGIIATDMTAVVQEKYDHLIEGGLLPLKRWGRPEDVARAVVALASGALPYSTGEVINVDGGFHLKRL
jgi:NAD(P)-dependent dehydrogenase (short-subunit alcohol dehydrogenase family)